MIGLPKIKIKVETIIMAGVVVEQVVLAEQSGEIAGVIIRSTKMIISSNLQTNSKMMDGAMDLII